MTPEEEHLAREWFRQCGIELDDEGVPVIRASTRPPQPCLRCGVIVEGPNETVFMRKGVVSTGAVCVGCYRLMMTRGKEFWEEWPSHQAQPKPPFTLETLTVILLRIIIIAVAITLVLWFLRK